MEKGRFRQDFCFRLNVARVHLPPLRERRSNIRALLDHSLQHLNRERGVYAEGISAETREALERYDWPGNVRELKNLAEAIFVVPPRDALAFRPDRGSCAGQKSDCPKFTRGIALRG